ncbi:MAG: DUF4124 domain-containing protein [Betaproteobacteria bacterium]|nr:MAG: DUF4124 domain-containing protein [Betaproteobacteria bacterium]TAG44188.1 MAG: DUF4124 domain-containing protein [Betaproteobacteria bacterium]
MLAIALTRCFVYTFPPLVESLESKKPMTAVKFTVSAAVFASVLATASIAQAEIYKYVDPVTGAVEYTNQPKKGATRLSTGETLSEIPTGNRPARAKGSAAEPRAVKVSANSGTNENAGKTDASVDASTQRTRDGTRKQVLSDELSIEEKALADARLGLNNGKPLPMADESVGSPKYIDRVKQLEKSVRHHERNIAALKQELANLRL